MHILFLLLVIGLVIGLLFLPSYWVKKVLEKYKQPAELYEGTGAELARHLLDRFQLSDVKVEETEPDQDHYDPTERAVRLSPDVYAGRSLTAITVATHEVGHAIQHASGYSLFRLRHQLVQLAQLSEKLGSIAIMAIPVFALITRSPAVGGLVMLLGIGGIAIGTLVHLVTLPVEWDASFGRALPILKRGEYIPEEHQRHARKILKAAAFTYVAGSLASLFNLYRWVAILRR